MSLSDGFIQGLSTPVPVAGAGLPDDMTLYAGGPLDPLKEHEAKYKQLDRLRRMSDRQSAKMLAKLEKAEHQYYGDKEEGEEEDMDKVSFVSNHPLLRRQYLLKMAQEPSAPVPELPSFDIGHTNKWDTPSNIQETEEARADLVRYRDPNTPEYRSIHEYDPTTSDDVIRGDLSKMRGLQSKVRENIIRGKDGNLFVPTTAKEYYEGGGHGMSYPEYIRGLERSRVLQPRLAQDIGDLVAKGRAAGQRELEDRIGRVEGGTSYETTESGRIHPRIPIHITRTSTRSIPEMSRAELDTVKGELSQRTPVRADFGRQEFGLLPESQRADLGGSYDAYLDNQARILARRRAYTKRDTTLRDVERLKRLDAEDKARKQLIDKRWSNVRGQLEKAEYETNADKYREQATRDIAQRAGAITNPMYSAVKPDGFRSTPRPISSMSRRQIEDMVAANPEYHRDYEPDKPFTSYEFRQLPPNQRKRLGSTYSGYLDRQAQAKGHRRAVAKRLGLFDDQRSKANRDMLEQAERGMGYAPTAPVPYTLMGADTGIKRDEPIARMTRSQLDSIRDRFDPNRQDGLPKIKMEYGRDEYNLLPQSLKNTLGGDYDTYLSNQANILTQRRAFEARDRELVEKGIIDEVEQEQAKEEWAAEGERLRHEDWQLKELEKAQRKQDDLESEDILAQLEYETEQEEKGEEEARLLAQEDQRQREQEFKSVEQRLKDRSVGQASVEAPRNVRDRLEGRTGVNTAFRRAQRLKDLDAAYRQQLKVDPTAENLNDPVPSEPAPPPEEPGYWDRTKGFFSDVGDGLKGIGTRVVRQGTQGLQQLANYGLRNSEFLEGLVDDAEEAKILVSLIEGSEGPQREAYLKQLQDFANNQALRGERDARTLATVDSLAGGNYQALKDLHLRDMATNRYGEEEANAMTPDSELYKQMEEEYGRAFDAYYGRGELARELGINPLRYDGLGAMFDDAILRTNARMNAFRRAKQDISPDQKVMTDPRSVTPKPFKALTAMPLSDLTQDTQDYMAHYLPGVDLNNPAEVGTALQGMMEQGQPEAMNILTYMGEDLQPHQMNKVLMTTMPQALTIGAELNKMSDEEAVEFVNNLPAGYRDQLDKLTSLSARYIAPAYLGDTQAAMSPTPNINRIREATDEEIAQHGGWLDRTMNWGPLSLLNTQYIDESNLGEDGIDKIDTELGWTGSGSGAGKWYVVPGADSMGSTLLFNPQTGEFNREWVGTVGNFEQLPTRYNESLHRALQRQEDSLLPTVGTYF